MRTPAILDQTTDLPAITSTRPTRIPPKVRRACELLADGNVKTVTAAADRVGMSREWLSKMLQRDHVRVFFARKSAETIATAQLRASNRFVQLIDAESEHVAAKVCDRILTSEGLLKSDAAQVSVSVDIKAGYVLDLRDPPSVAHTAHMREIEAKPLKGNGAGRHGVPDDS